MKYMKLLTRKVDHLKGILPNKFSQKGAIKTSALFQYIQYIQYIQDIIGTSNIAERLFSVA